MSVELQIYTCVIGIVQNKLYPSDSILYHRYYCSYLKLPVFAVERYEIANQKVYLYLNEIVQKPTKLAFTITRAVNVKSPEPASVTVYDYYEPSVNLRLLWLLKLNCSNGP